MFRKLLTTTAVAALLTGAAIAQESTTPAPSDPATQTPPAAAAPADQAQTPPATTPTTDTAATPAAKTDGQLASNIIGESVYNGTTDTAENIGDVNDMVLDANGTIKSIVVGVGGFLGVGEKNVEVDYKEAQWTEKNGDRWIVVSLSKEQIEALPAFDAAPYEPTPATTGSTAPSAAPAADPTAPPAAAPQNEQPKPAN